MSYCQIVTFEGGQPKRAVEYRNAWGGAARIWDALFKKYLEDPAIPYHTWLNEKEQKKLWNLAKRSDLPLFDRAVHASTFDYAYVARKNFQQFTRDLRLFVSAHPVKGGQVDHLPTWATFIDDLGPEAEAIGFYGTSVAENPWFRYDEALDAEIPVNLKDGFEIYDWIAQQT